MSLDSLRRKGKKPKGGVGRESEWLHGAWLATGEPALPDEVVWGAGWHAGVPLLSGCWVYHVGRAPWNRLSCECLAFVVSDWKEEPCPLWILLICWLSTARLSLLCGNTGLAMCPCCFTEWPAGFWFLSCWWSKSCCFVELLHPHGSSRLGCEASVSWSFDRCFVVKKLTVSYQMKLNQG